ncbi:MAG TPA: nucleotidyltransferase domain-containing protein [Anaerolineae bacterium]|nr:nucleotidyltransferase domain-containing protein [Anaerolineae bacterium]
MIPTSSGSAVEGVGAVKEEGLRHLTDRERAVLNEFLSKVLEQHGSDVELIRLFGSKVRGDFDEESDIDVLVVVNKDGQLWDDLVALEVDLMLKYNVVISSLIMSKENYEWHRRYRAPLYRSIEREGVDLWMRTPKSSSVSA